MTSSQDALEKDTDIALVRRFKEGDESAFETVFRRHKDAVYSLVYRTVGPGDAEDVAQEAFIRTYKSLGNYRGEASLKTWIFRVTLNACYDHMRRQSRRPLESPLQDLSGLASRGGDPASGASTCWARRELEEAIAALPDVERSLVEMHYVQGLSYREMAGALKCPGGTVKARIHSAVAKLRQRLVPLIEEVDQQ